MKTKDILCWVVNECVNGEDIGIIDVPEEDDAFVCQDEEWWIETFGAYPPSAIEAGKYLYYYRSAISEWIKDEYGNYQEPDAEIEIGDDYAYLYKIND